MVSDKITKSALCVLLLSFFVSLFLFSDFREILFSGEVEKYEKEIERRKDEKEEVLSQLEQVQEEISRIQSSGYSLDEQIRLINIEMQRIEDEMERVEQDLSEREEEISSKEEDLADKQAYVEEISGKLYKHSRYSFLEIFFRQSNDNGFLQALIFGRFVITSQISYMREVVEEMVGLREERDVLEAQKEIFEKDQAEFEESRGLLSLEKSRIQSELNEQVAIRGVLTSKVDGLERQISNLLEEQKEAARREAEMLPDVPPPQATEPPKIPDGGFYITGRGRDARQGHGVGMSQWGAYGGAQNGMKAEDIIKFYFKGVGISGGYENESISVQGYGTMNIEDYVAGFGAWAGDQGEIPAKACGTKEQVKDNPDKYTQHQGCWPEEAIKAQAIAYRTYALHYVSRGGSICTTASCQVYNGKKHTAWAAEETKGLVATYNGSIISAVYSADNSQGSGTANNDTVWQNFRGNGTPYDYLRAVNDSSFAQTTIWTNWVYQTKGYTYADVFEMLNFTANNSKSTVTSGTKANVRNTISGAKSIKEIRLERDPSQRVRKVFLTFDNGKTETIGGWWFKNLWIHWQYDIGGNDFIYSQTFFINYD